MNMLLIWPQTQAECRQYEAIVSWIRHLLNDANNRYTFCPKCSGSEWFKLYKAILNKFTFTCFIDVSGQVTELDEEVCVRGFSFWCHLSGQVHRGASLNKLNMWQEYCFTLKNIKKSNFFIAMSLNRCMFPPEFLKIGKLSTSKRNFL